MTAPIIKWVGGKRRLVPELLKRAPRSFGRYYEPCVGGGAMFFALNPQRAVLADLNGDLMRMYSAIARKHASVSRALAIYGASHNAAHYDLVRRVWNEDGFADTPDWERASAFIYLNRTCYNGLWRVNQEGKFNAPMGRYAVPRMPSHEEIAAVATRLAGDVKLRCGPYWQTIGDAERGDFIYFDPPYDGNFTGYTMAGFTRDDQLGLADSASAHVERGCQVMISNADTPFIRKLYNDRGFKIDRVLCGRAINSDTTGRGKVGEVIATAGYKRGAR